MERMNAYQEIAFDKLYKWTQTEARSLGQDNLEVSKTMSLALKALRQRPTLFQYVSIPFTLVSPIHYVIKLQMLCNCPIVSLYFLTDIVWKTWYILGGLQYLISS